MLLLYLRMRKIVESSSSASLETTHANVCYVRAAATTRDARSDTVPPPITQAGGEIETIIRATYGICMKSLSSFNLLYEISV